MRMKQRCSAMAIALGNTRGAAPTVVAVAPLAGAAKKIEELVILSGLGFVGWFCPYISPVCMMEE